MKMRIILSWLISIIFFWKIPILGSQQSNIPKPLSSVPSKATPSTSPVTDAPATTPVVIPNTTKSPTTPGITPTSPVVNESTAIPSPVSAEPTPSNAPAGISPVTDPNNPEISPPAPDQDSSDPSKPAIDQKDSTTDSVKSSPNTSPPNETPPVAKGPYDPNLEDLWNCKYNQNFALDKCIEIQSFFCSRCSRLTCAILDNRSICLDICDSTHPLMQPCVQAGKMNVRKLPALPPDPKLVQQMMMQQQQMMMMQQMMGLGMGGIGAAAKGIGGLFRK